MLEADRKARVLLHICCGPCAAACVERLQADHDVVLLWYNPNLTDPREHEKRLQAARRLAERVGTPLIEGPLDVAAWRAATRGLEGEPEGGRRCEACFRVRLMAAARKARELGIDRFTTTLSISPHKSFPQICAAGEAACRETGVEFLPVDFKKRGGFQRSSELAAEQGLYRQDYCGCESSKRERDARRGTRARRQFNQPV